MNSLNEHRSFQWWRKFQWLQSLIFQCSQLCLRARLADLTPDPSPYLISGIPRQDTLSFLLDKDGSDLLYLPLRKPLKPNPSTCDQSRDPSIHMSVGRNLSYLSLLRILYLPGIIARAWINLHVQYSCVGVWSSEKPRKPRHSFIKLWFLTMSMSYLHVIKSLSKISGSKKIYITIYICIYPRILSSFFVMNKCALNKQFVTSYLRTRFSNI